MTIETSSIAAPAAWASALINGDESGLEQADIDAMFDWLTEQVGAGWHVYDVIGEPYFSHAYALHGGTASGGDLVDYAIFRDME